MKRIRWAEVTAKFTGAKYKLGGWSREEGYDCLSVLVLILREIGIDIPEDLQMGIVNFNNYAKLWQENPSRAKEAMVKLVESIAEEVPLGQRQSGDLLLLTVKGEYKNDYPYPFVGLTIGDKVISSTEAFGVRAYKLSYFKIRKCYRLKEIN